MHQLCLGSSTLLSRPSASEVSTTCLPSGGYSGCVHIDPNARLVVAYRSIVLVGVRRVLCPLYFIPGSGHFYREGGFTGRCGATLALLFYRQRCGGDSRGFCDHTLVGRGSQLLVLHVKAGRKASTHCLASYYKAIQLFQHSHKNRDVKTHQLGFCIFCR